MPAVWWVFFLCCVLLFNFQNIQYVNICLVLNIVFIFMNITLFCMFICVLWWVALFVLCCFEYFVNKKKTQDAPSLLLTLFYFYNVLLLNVWKAFPIISMFFNSVCWFEYSLLSVCISISSSISCRRRNIILLLSFTR